MASITGVKELDRQLAKLSGPASRKAAAAGVRAALRPISKALRAAVNASSATPAVKREARKTIGQRFKKARGGPNAGQREAKAGFAVGKKRAQAKKTGEGKSRGVGLSVANVHWFVLGTRQRYHRRLKTRSKKVPDALKFDMKKPTGRIPPVLEGLAGQACASSASASIAAAQQAIRKVIHQEAAKKG